MNRRFALIMDNIVVNTIMWTGMNGWKPPAGIIAVLIPDGMPVQIGDKYINGQFILQLPFSEDELIPENLISEEIVDTIGDEPADSISEEKDK